MVQDRQAHVHRLPVEERLAHAHEHDVGGRLARRVEQELAHLARDLRRREVAPGAPPPPGAETPPPPASPPPPAAEPAPLALVDFHGPESSPAGATRLGD